MLIKRVWAVLNKTCRKRPKTRCYVCGKPMTSLCDATRKNGKPCDVPMCDEHRNRVGTDVDVCHYHNYPNHIKKAYENRIERAKARLYFVEKYKKQDFGLVLGHYPDFATKEEVDKWMDFQKAALKTSKELSNETEICNRGDSVGKRFYRGLIIGLFLGMITGLAIIKIWL